MTGPPRRRADVCTTVVAPLLLVAFSASAGPWILLGGLSGGSSWVMVDVLAGLLTPVLWAAVFLGPATVAALGVRRRSGHVVLTAVAWTVVTAVAVVVGFITAWAVACSGGC